MNGGYARGDETQLRVIRTAIAVFGSTGYEKSSVRQIASQAGVHPPAVQYYFQSKAGLYHSCIDFVTKEILNRLQPALSHAQDALERNKNPETAIEQICVLQDILVDAFYAEDEGSSVLRLLGSENELPETADARHLMRDRVNLPMFRVVSRLVGAIVDMPADDLITGLHAFAIFGPVMAFHLDQRRIADALGWSEPDDDGIRLLKSILRSQSIILLRGLAADAQARTGASVAANPAAQASAETGGVAARGAKPMDGSGRRSRGRVSQSPKTRDGGRS